MREKARPTHNRSKLFVCGLISGVCVLERSAGSVVGSITELNRPHHVRSAPFDSG